MKLSARNQINGTVAEINEGAVNGIVKISFADTQISATISMSAIKDLELAVGKKACAIIKATEVMVGKGELCISARNKFKGVVESVDEGAVNGIVKLRIAGDNVISSTISMSAIKELELVPGKEAVAVIKATSVMVGVEE